MSLGSCCPLCDQLCDLPKEVLSQIVGLCRRDFRSMRQVNRCLKVAVDLEVRGIRIALQRGSGAEAADALDRKSPLALQRKYPKLRQVILHGYGLGVITVFLRKINNWESLIIGGNPPAVHSSLSLEEDCLQDDGLLLVLPAHYFLNSLCDQGQWKESWRLERLQPSAK